MKKIKCLFLGYNSKQTKLISFLNNKKINVFQKRNYKVNSKIINKYDVCICYGYRKILNQSILKKLNRPIINLHISYLPYNRGVYPNLNSFINNTPKGVSIHEIDKGLDTGKIIFQKKVFFKITNKTNFKDTYKILRKEIEKLNIKNYKSLIFYRYKTTKQKKLSLKYQKTFKSKINWNIPIKKYLSKNYF